VAFSAGGDGDVTALDLASSHLEGRGTGERIAHGQHDDRAHGYEATREAAMAAFAKSSLINRVRRSAG
jgi:hypothetical protein